MSSKCILGCTLVFKNFDIVSEGRRGGKSYLGLWFDGDKDVGQQRLWTQRAVESDDSSKEGPKHHDDVYISVQTQENRKKKLPSCKSHYTVLYYTIIVDGN